MAARRPLVLASGALREMPLGDQLAAEALAVPDFSARAAAMGAAIPAALDAVRVLGYAAGGDRGGGVYRRAAGPSRPFNFQSADSAWWELAEEAPWATQIGCVGDGATDNTDKLVRGLEKYGIVKVNWLNGGAWFQISDALPAYPGGGLVGLGAGSYIRACNNYGKRHLVTNANWAPANAAARDAGIQVLNLRLDGNKANNPTAIAANGESSGVFFRAAKDCLVMGVQADNVQGDGFLLMSKQGDQSMPCEGVRVLYCRSDGAARSGASAVEAIDGTMILRATRYALHGFDIEPDGVLSTVRNWDVAVYAEAGGADALSAALACTEGGGGLVQDIRGIVSTYGITGAALLFRATDALVMEVLHRSPVLGHAIYGLDSGARPSRAKIRGYVEVPSGGYAGLLTRTAGDKVDTDGLAIVSASNAEAVNLQLAVGGQLRGLSVRFTGSGASRIGLALYGCTGVTAPDAVFDNTYQDVNFAMKSGVTATTYCVVGGRSLGPADAVAVESAGCDYNGLDGLVLEGATKAVTLVGANSWKRGLVGSGAAAVAEDAALANLTFGVPGAVPGLALATATIAVSGAVVGQLVQVIAAPAAPPAGYGPPQAWVASAGQVQVAYPQWSGAAAAPTACNGSHTVRAQKFR